MRAHRQSVAASVPQCLAARILSPTAGGPVISDRIRGRRSLGALEQQNALAIPLPLSRVGRDRGEHNVERLGIRRYQQLLQRRLAHATEHQLPHLHA